MSANPSVSRRSEWLAAFDSASRLTNEEQARLLQATLDKRDVCNAARQRMALAALGTTEMAPWNAIGHLRQAISVFDASGLLRESRLARSELAAQLIEAACPEEALVALGEAAAVPVAMDGAPWAAEQARRALALFDQGSLAAAVDSTRLVLQSLGAWNRSSASRLAEQTWAAVLDVLIGTALAIRDIDSGLAEGAMGSAHFRSADQSSGINELLGLAATAAVHAAQTNIHVATQLALLQALDKPAGAAERCESLTSALSGRHSHHPFAWLRLALAFRLAGRRVLAAHCANEAVMIARAQHQTRSHQRALVEMALIQHESGVPAEAAATWLALRQLQRKESADRPSDWRWGVGSPSGRAPATVSGPFADRPSRAHVNAALKSIVGESPASLSVPALALHCGVSRRTLEQAFRAEQGQTVGEAIRQRKLQVALNQLERTDHAIKRVAIDAGFGSASALCRELRRHTGLSPVQYRLRARSA